MMKRSFNLSALLVACLSLTACDLLNWDAKPQPRLSMFVGVDISGSFVESGHFEDSMNFLAHYLYAHLQGLGELSVPKTLFVGPIGGASKGEPKTFFPIQTFQGKTIRQIREKLKEIFPKDEQNPFTDYNAFFRQISTIVHNKKLLLRPVEVVMLSDGKIDVPGAKGKKGFKKIDLQPLGKLARSVTVRLLYTDAVTGNGWQNRVPRKRVKVWTLDAAVMKDWKESNILVPGKKFEEQGKFFSWLKDNVDFGIRGKRVD